MYTVKVVCSYERVVKQITNICLTRMEKNGIMNIYGIIFPTAYGELFMKYMKIMGDLWRKNIFYIDIDKKTGMLI